MPKFAAHKILYSILGVFLTVIILLSGTIIYVANNGLRNVAVNQGSNALGRTLSIEKLDLAWHWRQPQVRIKNIKIANTEGAVDPDLFTANQINFRIKIWPLLIGRMEFPEFELDAPKLLLEKKDEDTKNWELPMFSQGKATTEAVVPDSRSEFPVIGLLSIKDGSLTYRDVPRKMNVTLNLDTAIGAGGDGERALKVTGDGTLQDQKFELEAQGGSIDMLRDADKDYPLLFKLTMGGTQIDLQGTFRDPVQLEGVDATLSIKGNNLADLFYLTSIPLPPTPAYRLTGQLVKKGDVWAYNNFDGLVGGSDLKGNLSYDTSGERGFVKIDLASKLLDMKDLGGFIGLSPDNPKEQIEAANRVLPDVPINLDRLRATDMDVNLKADVIKVPNIPVNRLNTHIVLKEGVLSFDPLDLGIAKGTIEGSLVLDGSKEVPSVKSDLVIKRLSLREFFGESFEDLTSGRFGGRIQIVGSGKSLADVLGTSNGRMTFLMAGGKISLLIIEAAGLDIAQAAPLLLDKDKSTNIRCAIGDFKVTNGILNSETFVFDTTDTNVAGTAQINLKSEEMDIEVQAHPKDASILAAKTPITIGGTMKDPSIGIQPIPLAGKGAVAAALGVLLTPVAAIIPFIELGLGEDSDCRGLITQARNKSGAPPPTSSTN